jgi:hypothetical protein
LKTGNGDDEVETQEDRVIALTEAYRVLSDPELRADYERTSILLRVDKSNANSEISFACSVADCIGSGNVGKNGTNGVEGTTRQRQRNPTRVISLEEWTYHPATATDTTKQQAQNGHRNGTANGHADHDDANGHADHDDANGAYYTHPCRCSGTFVITESQLEEGVDIVGCEGCGEWVGVGYEVVEDGDEGEEEAGDAENADGR